MRPKTPVIRRLVLERYRSIPSACVTFDNPTILVGRNGSGKSNLISAFSFLADAMKSPLRTVLDRVGGLAAVRNRSSGTGHPPKLGIRADLANPHSGAASAFYAFEIKSRPNHGFSVSREQCVVSSAQSRFWFYRHGKRFQTNVENFVQPPVDESSLILPVVGGLKVFWAVWHSLAGLRVYAIDPGELRKMQDPDPGFSLQPNGRNATSVLREIEKRVPAAFELIARVLRTVVPNLDAVLVKTLGKNLVLQFTQRWGADKRLTFDAFNMSDGTLRALGILTALFQSESPPLIAVEEPEATIHPGALESILEVLRIASESRQVVITTHSPELLDTKWITDRNLRLVDWRDGATHVNAVSAANRTAIQQHLMGAGELLRANALEPAGDSHPRIQLFESL